MFSLLAFELRTQNFSFLTFKLRTQNSELPSDSALRTSWSAFLANSFLIPHFSFHIPQYLTVIHPMTRLPIVSPNGCSLCLSFNALKAEMATSASRI
jgi:hypothetical protein